ncbi:MAG TPA: hypothetical protein V6C69_10930 [Trichormus sp.]|jgi:hypothetical protein
MNFAMVHGTAKESENGYFVLDQGAYAVGYMGSKLRTARLAFVEAKEGATVVCAPESCVTADAGAFVLAMKGASVIGRAGSFIYAKAGAWLTLEAGAFLFLEGPPAELNDRGAIIIDVDKDGNVLKPAEDAPATEPPAAA